jgi:hypothetical protein
MSFPWEGRVPVSTRRVRQMGMKEKAVGKDKKSSGATPSKVSSNVA